MLNVKKVLFPTDFFPCANQALDHALYLAKRHGAELHMLHAIVLHQEDPHNPVAHVIDLQEMEEHLETLAEKDMEDSIQHLPDDAPDIVRARVRGVSAADVILEYAEDERHRPHRHGNPRPTGSGASTAGKHGRGGPASCTLPCPHHQGTAGTPDARGCSQILAPVDYSDHARSAMNHAREMAAAYEAEVDLLHVIEDLVHPVFYWQGGLRRSRAQGGY